MISPFHSVQFYQDDVFLAESVARFIQAGLKIHDTVIIVATPQHRDDLLRALAPRDMVNEKLMFLDARELLSTFMIDNWPCESRFMKVIGDLIQHAGQQGRVRVFVAVLWTEEKARAAIRLEELWNELATQQPFLLFCAYPASVFKAEEGTASLLAVCQTHAHVHHQTTSSFDSRSEAA